MIALLVLGSLLSLIGGIITVKIWGVSWFAWLFAALAYGLFSAALWLSRQRETADSHDDKETK